MWREVKKGIIKEMTPRWPEEEHWKEGSKGYLRQCARHVLNLRAGKHLLFGERKIIQCDERIGWVDGNEGKNWGEERDDWMLVGSNDQPLFSMFYMSFNMLQKFWVKYC